MYSKSHTDLTNITFVYPEEHSEANYTPLYSPILLPLFWRTHYSGWILTLLNP